MYSPAKAYFNSLPAKIMLVAIIAIPIALMGFMFGKFIHYLAH